MSLPSLDAICIDLGSVRQLSGALKVSDSSQPAMQFARRKATDTEVYQVKKTNARRSEFTALYSIFDGVRYAGAVAWTPPKESTPRAWKFVDASFTHTAHNAYVFDFSFQLRFQPSVAT